MYSEIRLTHKCLASILYLNVEYRMDQVGHFRQTCLACLKQGAGIQKSRSTREWIPGQDGNAGC
jgi:hypothetical protein